MMEIDDQFWCKLCRQYSQQVRFSTCPGPKFGSIAGCLGCHVRIPRLTLADLTSAATVLIGRHQLRDWPLSRMDGLGTRTIITTIIVIYDAR